MRSQSENGILMKRFHKVNGHDFSIRRDFVPIVDEISRDLKSRLLEKHCGHLWRDLNVNCVIQFLGIQTDASDSKF